MKCGIEASAQRMAAAVKYAQVERPLSNRVDGDGGVHGKVLRAVDYSEWRAGMIDEEPAGNSVGRERFEPRVNEHCRRRADGRTMLDPGVWRGRCTAAVEVVTAVSGPSVDERMAHREAAEAEMAASSRLQADAAVQRGERDPQTTVSVEGGLIAVEFLVDSGSNVHILKRMDLCA